ncbi:hypothetical protein LWI28_025960 [Acer negundo]|uniref:Endonuclease/exonuclease/phosphatase domain-containing protein n=1 Tax=Acer negundo TaxID=4023 RepID=A0AAD5JJB4_ACENE|nr:hypothetical protein LWI28_008018 [Acer negundo]KAI9196672.1 hypothetical protein LWI28_025960 [Acer negundo]KAK4856191.1 hypothetical protein QYF36_015025 [Acer negundo]
MAGFGEESKVSWSVCPKFVPAEGATRFRLVSYNMLAESYIRFPYYSYCPPGCLDGRNRSKATLTLLRELQSDFLCLQELDEYFFYKAELETYGYYAMYIQRDRQGLDGCGIFYKHNVAELLIKNTIKYNDLSKSCYDDNLGCNDGGCYNDDLGRNDDDLGRNCVGIMAAFRLKGAPSNHIVIVANTHIFWDPWLSHVKFAQAKYLTQRLFEFKTLVLKKFRCTEPSIIVAGDFNSNPNSMVYRYLISSYLNSKLWIENNEVVTEVESFEETEVEYFEEPVPMPLCSVYALVKGREPEFTNCKPEFKDTLDYIFFSPSRLITPISVLELPDSTKSADVIGGLPNFYHPSDHLPIAAEFEIRKIKYA